MNIISNSLKNTIYLLKYSHNTNFINISNYCMSSIITNKYNYKSNICCTYGSKNKFSTQTISSDKEGIFKNLMKKVGFSPNIKSKIRVSSFILYESVADNINYQIFFQKFSLPNTFNSWFLVTELHVWMLLLRSMGEGSENGQDGRFLRNCIVEAMWSDVNTRAKKLGADNPSQTRAQIQVLAQQFQAALITYDEGIMSDDKTLAGAVWRRFFEKECVNYEHIENLVHYIRCEVQYLDSLSREEFLIKPNVKWIHINNI